MWFARSESKKTRIGTLGDCSPAESLHIFHPLSFISPLCCSSVMITSSRSAARKSHSGRRKGRRPKRVLRELMWKSEQLKTFRFFLDMGIWRRLCWRQTFAPVKNPRNHNQMCALFSRLLYMHQKSHRDFQRQLIRWITAVHSLQWLSLHSRSKVGMSHHFPVSSFGIKGLMIPHVSQRQKKYQNPKHVCAWHDPVVRRVLNTNEEERLSVIINTVPHRLFSKFGWYAHLFLLNGTLGNRLLT